MSEASDWLDALPNKPCALRDTMILDAAKSNLLTCEWLPILSEGRGHRIHVYVSDDALHVILGDGSRFRPQVSANLLQRIADVKRAMMCTSKVADLAYESASVTLRSVITPPGDDMDSIAWSKAYNVRLEKLRTGRSGLIRDAGKDWLISNLLLMVGGRACNMGQRDPGASFTSHSGIRLYQPKSTRHNGLHSDQTQVATLMLDECDLDGQVVSTASMLQSNEYFELLSDESTTLKVLRQPGVERIAL